MTLPRRNGKRQSNRELRTELHGQPKPCNAHRQDGSRCEWQASDGDYCFVHNLMLKEGRLPKERKTSGKR